jgi:hypothetical protein
VTTCTAAWNQKAFRGRNDNGDETTATWKANQNVGWTQDVDTNFRVRFEVQETAACAGNNKVWQLQYNLGGAGWVSVTASSSVVRSSASPNLADAANLTNQLTVGTGTFQGATGFDEVDGAAGGNSMDVAASGHAEAEFCVQIRSVDVSDGNTIQLRVTDNGAAFAAYDATPSITVREPITVTPGTAALTTATFAPSVTVSDNKTVTPGAVALTLTTFAPTVTTDGNVEVIPGTASLTASTFAPTVSVSDNKRVTPGTASLTLATFAPTISATANQIVVPGVASLVLSSFAPTVTATGQVEQTQESSGGWPIFDRTRAAEDIQRERERLGILPKAVEAVRAAAVIEERLQLQQEEAARAQLERELAQLRDEYLGAYRQAFVEAQIESFVLTELMNQWCAEVCARREFQRRRKALLLFLLH